MKRNFNRIDNEIPQNEDKQKLSFQNSKYTCLKLLWSSVQYLYWKFLECICGPWKKYLATGSWEKEWHELLHILAFYSPQTQPCLKLPLVYLEIPSSSHSGNKESKPGVVLCYPDGCMEAGEDVFWKSEVTMEKWWLKTSLKKATLNEWYSLVIIYDKQATHACISRKQFYCSPLRRTMNIKGWSSQKLQKIFICGAGCWITLFNLLE